MIKAFKKSIQSFFYLFYPRVCSGCGQGLATGEKFICISCHQELQPTDYAKFKDNTFYNLIYPRVPIENAVAFYFFTKGGILQNLMHEIKYKSKKDLGIYLGKQFGVYLKQSTFINEIDVIIPIPLHEKKEYQRGFNQSFLLAQGMSEVLNIPLLNNTVERNLNTSTQTNLTRIERWENVKEAFFVKNTDRLRNKHILIIDDVMTTGATLEACAMQILKIEGTKVSLATLAFVNDL